MNYLFSKSKSQPFLPTMHQFPRVEIEDVFKDLKTQTTTPNTEAKLSTHRKSILTPRIHNIDTYKQKERTNTPENINTRESEKHFTVSYYPKHYEPSKRAMNILCARQERRCKLSIKSRAGLASGGMVTRSNLIADNNPVPSFPMHGLQNPGNTQRSASSLSSPRGVGVLGHQTLGSPKRSITQRDIPSHAISGSKYTPALASRSHLILQPNIHVNVNSNNVNSNVNSNINSDIIGMPPVLSINAPQLPSSSIKYKTYKKGVGGTVRAAAGAIPVVQQKYEFMLRPGPPRMARKSIGAGMGEEGAIPHLKHRKAGENAHLHTQQLAFEKNNIEQQYISEYKVIYYIYILYIYI